VYGDLKGTPMPDPGPGQDVVLEIDLQGAHQIRRLRPGALVVFIAPPSRAEQERRLRSRGDDEADVQRRLAKADAEEDEGRAIADLVVVNDDVDRAVAEIRAEIEKRRAITP
jgi:guanylate kinase